MSNNYVSSGKMPLAVKVSKYASLLWSRKFWLLFVGITAVVCSMLFFYTRNVSTATAILSLRYEKAYDGQYPNGTRFNIYDLESDEVLEKTIERLGLEGVVTPKQLAMSLSLSPASTQNVYNEYIATDYSVTLNNKAFPEGYSAKSILTVLMEVYTQVFQRNYATNDDSLELDWSEVEDWDYMDFGSFMNVKINKLISFLDEFKNTSGMSQYSLEGETFHSLRATVVNFRNIHLDAFNSLVLEKNLFRDPDNYREKLDYRQFLLRQEMEKYQSEFEIRQEALKLYDESMITFVMVPMYDYSDGLYMARTAIGTDDLAKESASYADSLSVRELRMAELEQTMERVSNANTNERDLARADKMIDEIQEQIDGLIVRIREVTENYEENRSKSDISYYIRTPRLKKLFNLKMSLVMGVMVIIVMGTCYCVYAETRKGRR